MNCRHQVLYRSSARLTSNFRDAIFLPLCSLSVLFWAALENDVCLKYWVLLRHAGCLSPLGGLLFNASL